MVSRYSKDELLSPVYLETQHTFKLVVVSSESYLQIPTATNTVYFISVKRTSKCDAPDSNDVTLDIIISLETLR